MRQRGANTATRGVRRQCGARRGPKTATRLPNNTSHALLTRSTRVSTCFGGTQRARRPRTRVDAAYTEAMPAGADAGVHKIHERRSAGGSPARAHEAHNDHQTHNSSACAGVYARKLRHSGVRRPRLQAVTDANKLRLRD